MLSKENIVRFCSKYNYDLRVSNNGRWIDQKCTPDVVSAIADFIYTYCSETNKYSFTSKDIWYYKYSINNVELIFKKPNVTKSTSKNEYDKFFQQPMEMFANAGILLKEKKGNKNIYTLKEKSVLEYISIKERNALNFLIIYIEKVLNDSSIYDAFSDFFALQTKESFFDLKYRYSNFIINNTKINGKTECNRIFTKVLNPLAFNYDSLGTEKGVLSKNKITYDMLMYNRNNFRDIYSKKPKDITRKDYNSEVVINNEYYKYTSKKAKKFLKIFNDRFRNSQSEYLNDLTNPNDPADNIHHIFPESHYPEISDYYENLIALTPTQHYSYAHPRFKTQEIDETYQHLLLLAKTDRIKENITDDTIDTIYDFDDLLIVLSIGFNEIKVLDIENMNFEQVINAINIHYDS